MDWQNENSHRSYPFRDYPTVTMSLSVNSVTQNYSLPFWAVTDFVSVTGHAAMYDADDRMFLVGIVRTADRFTFTFSTSVISEDLVFEIPLETEEYAVCHSQIIDEEYDVPAWEGWLTVGNMNKLRELLPNDGDSLAAVNENMQLEPATNQSLHGHYISGITLVNAARLRVEPVEGCGELPEEPANHVNVTRLVGDIRFAAGYNTQLRPSIGNNALVFNAVAGAGEGEPVEEILLYNEETSPDGGQLLTGGPRCDELIGAINGVTGNAISFLAGTGVNIRPAGPEMPHALVVDITLQGLANCAEFSSEIWIPQNE